MNNSFVLPENIEIDWVLDELLGVGGFGAVYKIHNKKTNQERALKRIHFPTLFIDTDISIEEKEKCANQFENELHEEFAAISGFNCPNIVHYYHEFNVPGENFEFDHFFIMDLLTPLGKKFPSNRLSEKDVVKLGIDICEALSVLEKHNIIHGDITPNNIFVASEDTYVLGDFGNMKRFNSPKASNVIGTKNFIAPEVEEKKEYDIRSDIFSLGKTLCSLLGIKDNSNENTDFGGRDTALNNVSVELVQIVKKACLVDKNSRYNTPDEFKKALESYYPRACTERIDEINVVDAFSSRVNISSIITSVANTKSDIAKNNETWAFPEEEPVAQPEAEHELTHFMDWLFFTCTIGLVPTIIYFMCSFLIGGVSIKQEVYIHEILFFSIVVLMSALRDTIFGHGKKNHKKEYMVLTLVSVFMLLIVAALFMLIVIYEVLEAANGASRVFIAFNSLFSISILICICSAILGVTVALWEDQK